MISREWEYDMSNNPTIRIWWMPQITQDEVEQRHQQKLKNEKKLRAQANRMKKAAERLGSFADMFDETGFIGKWLNKKVDALDEKSAKLEAEMEGKKILGKPKEEQVQGDTSGGGFDDDDGTGLESLGVLGAANLKMKMKRFSKIAHKNQAGNNTSGNVGSGGDDNGEYYNDESQYYEDQGNGDDGTYGEEGYYDENQNYYDTAEQQQGDDAYVDQQQQQQYGGGDY